MSFQNIDQIFEKIAKPEKIISQKVFPITFGDGNFFVATLSQVIIETSLNGSATNKHFLTKIANPTSKAGKSVSMDRIFFNEVTFYQNFSSVYHELVPKFYFGQLGECGEMHVLVLEYLDGYKMYPEMRVLPYDHVVFACKNLGVFHGLGYIAKAQDGAFETKCLEFKETRFHPTAMPDEFYPVFCYFCKLLSKRVFKFIPNSEVYDQEVLAKYEKLTEDIALLGERMVRPKNNLAVLCHGDYNRNNIMFQYDLSRIISMKLIDFQTIRYTQPSTDLATLFLMNIKADDLECNYEKYLKFYYDSLIETIRAELNVEEFGYKRFLEDYAKHCWIGYLAILIYHPLLDDPLKFGKTNILLESKISDEEMMVIVNDFGNKQTCEHMGRILKHCIDVNEKFEEQKYYCWLFLLTFLTFWVLGKIYRKPVTF